MFIDFSFKINFFFLYIFLIHFILSNSQDLTFEITGDSNNGKNNYYITLYIGEHKKPQTFLLDTIGSLFTSQCNIYSSNEKDMNSNYLNNIIKEKDILNCENNKKCINYPFSSCNNNKCEFEYYYKNSTIKGLYANQHLSFSEKEDSYIFPLGCSLFETNFFLTQEADGILGLNSQNNSFIDLLYKQKIISNKKFSICLNQKNGGYISFGQIKEIDNNQDKKSQKILISYIPFDSPNNGIYILDINSIYVDKGNNLIKNQQNKKSIIDSMSVKTYFTESIYNNLINEILSYCLNNKGNCKNIQKIENLGYCSIFKSKQEIIKSIDKYWPIIIIEFNGYNHALYPRYYFIANSSGGKIKACIGIEKSDNNYNILGTTFLNGYNVIFDNENKNIGFYESNCEINLIKDKNIENEEYINRVFDDPVNIIIVVISIGGIILLIVLLIILYRIMFKKTPKRKGYIRQVDINNSANQYLDNHK